ncbi:uncharacterized protein I303_108224 [Kwoniella dejecticola CBS 10117]|uniref:Uncharacterized protein n=1 Tax=Kwoniella dejecticola CBS 10117 TaxID=1296121 RepID=A0A1A5ZXZ8_9TREE|nr:uncharacterized protein I303_07450 [Kwoniella dejecticola CBS 10117]OBR82686.1 hypothetical protein I303_07450 [Kwoniella dejecticola CBS 10117]
MSSKLEQKYASTDDNESDSPGHPHPHPGAHPPPAYEATSSGFPPDHTDYRWVTPPAYSASRVRGSTAIGDGLVTQSSPFSSGSGSGSAPAPALGVGADDGKPESTCGSRELSWWDKMLERRKAKAKTKSTARSKSKEPDTSNHRARLKGTIGNFQNTIQSIQRSIEQAHIAEKERHLAEIAIAPISSWELSTQLSFREMSHLMQRDAVDRFSKVVAPHVQRQISGKVQSWTKAVRMNGLEVGPELLDNAFVDPRISRDVGGGGSSTAKEEGEEACGKSGDKIDTDTDTDCSDSSSKYILEVGTDWSRSKSRIQDQRQAIWTELSGRRNLDLSVPCISEREKERCIQEAREWGQVDVYFVTDDDDDDDSEDEEEEENQGYNTGIFWY